MKNLSIALACAYFLTACVTNAPTTSKADQRFVDIATEPGKFDGQAVTVVGWLTLRHEDRNLWATKKDHDSWETRRCISLVNGDLLEDRKGSLDGRYVRVTGILRGDATDNGAVIRLGSCRNVGLEIAKPDSVVPVSIPH